MAVTQHPSIFFHSDEIAVCSGRVFKLMEAGWRLGTDLWGWHNAKCPTNTRGNLSLGARVCFHSTTAGPSFPCLSLQLGIDHFQAGGGQI